MESNATVQAVRRRGGVARRCAVHTFAAMLLFACRANGADVLVSSEAPGEVEVTGVSIARDGAVAGTVVNRSDAALRDVRLVIHHGWLWTNEFQPGGNNPARTSYYVVPGEISAHGSVPFRYRPSPPLPRRRDGRFVTTVHVDRFTSVSF